MYISLSVIWEKLKAGVWIFFFLPLINGKNKETGSCVPQAQFLFLYTSEKIIGIKSLKENITNSGSTNLNWQHLLVTKHRDNYPSLAHSTGN